MSVISGNDGGAASEPSVNSMALWVEASGGMKKGKIFGMGSLSKAYTTKVAATSSSNAAGARRTRLEKQMTQELSQLKQKLVQMDEEMRAVKQQMQVIMRHLNLDHNDVSPVPPTNPIGDRHSDDEIAAAADDDDFDSHC